ncbi:hypothetical protein ACFO9Q_10525 [Paenibacillus sp. GCM10023252]|uniref:hypothetical protein n=1 Tax=Paenibacillus sp. GCM10023252 TaxID=3252649 RepID=UPI00360F4C89
MSKTSPTASRSFLFAIVLSILYAAIGLTHYYLAYYNEQLLRIEPIITLLLAVLFSMPIILFIRHGYWRVTMLALLLFVPIYAAAAYLFDYAELLPFKDEMFTFIILGFNVTSVVFGILLGVAVNALVRFRQGIETEGTARSRTEHSVD